MRNVDRRTLYGLFCVLSLVTNLGAQYLSQAWFGAGFWAGLFVGTGSGLALKYLLDRNYVFAGYGVGLDRDIRRFALYSCLGVFTTLVFWAFEWLGEFICPGVGRYAGGATGLTIGYVLKYQMDRRWVFAPAH